MISFIIPTLNEEKVIEKLLRNLREIKTFTYEIIVTDGGSTDKTVALAKTIADKVVEDAPGRRQTIAEGRNAGAAQAKGDFLVFLDADVYIFNPDEFFKRALKRFEGDSQLVSLGGMIKVFPETETFGDKIGYGIFTNGWQLLYNNIFKLGAGIGEFGMVKTSAFRQLKGFRAELAVAEDQDLFYRLSRIGHTRTDRHLVIYHTGRRPHAIGWPKLLWQWSKNWINWVIFDRSADTEWKVIR